MFVSAVALILFIYAITSGSSTGWGSAGVIAPLILSIFMVVGFFFYETRIPSSVAAVCVTTDPVTIESPLLTAFSQPTPNVVLAEFCRAIWCRAISIFLVDDHLHGFHDALARCLPLVSDRDRFTYVSHAFCLV